MRIATQISQLKLCLGSPLSPLLATGIRQEHRGEALIYTYGFLNIISFTSLLGQADSGEAWNCRRFLLSIESLVVDEGTTGCVDLPRLVCCVHPHVRKFCLFLLGKVVCLGKVFRCRRQVNDFGFSYITWTTAGLGDHLIPHKDFRVGDMFCLSLIMLSGFLVSQSGFSSTWCSCFQSTDHSRIFSASSKKHSMRHFLRIKRTANLSVESHQLRQW